MSLSIEDLIELDEFSEEIGCLVDEDADIISSLIKEAAEEEFLDQLFEGIMEE